MVYMKMEDGIVVAYEELSKDPQFIKMIGGDLK